MSISRQLELQICELSFKAVAGELSDEECARLDELVDSSDEARHWLIKYAALDFDLVFCIRARVGGTVESVSSH
jgi:hypothetical protein